MQSSPDLTKMSQLPYIAQYHQLPLKVFSFNSIFLTHTVRDKMAATSQTGVSNRISCLNIIFN